jgi:hypothetical protein
VTATTVPTDVGDLEDDNLDFGVMKMVPGNAFLLGTSSPSVAVDKQWVIMDGQQFLVEEVPVVSIADELSQLPLPQTTSTRPNPPLNVVSAKRLLPEHRLATVPGKHPMQLAHAAPSSRGLVLDYNTVNGSLTNQTFQGDTTYYISGALDLFGTNTFEGGTVLKYTNGASIILQSTNLTWLGMPYLPVIFTAKDDNSVGQPISDSTGTPTNYYANPALSVPGVTLSNLRISHAQQAILCTASSTFYNCQFVNCLNGVNPSGSTYIENALFANVQTNLDNIYHGGVYVRNATFNMSACIGTLVAGGGAVLINCILANVTTLGFGGLTLSGGTNGFYDSPVFGTDRVTNTFYPFQSVGAGSYYLTNGCSFINAGTTNIDPTLLADLQQMTTYPPMVYSNVVITNNLTLYPQAQRDNIGNPSLGYHYDPLDYVFGGCDLYTNLTVTNGAAIGWFDGYGSVSLSGQPYGISLNDGANLTFSGTATQPAWLAQYNMVQEWGNGIDWTNWTWMGGIILNGDGSGVTPQLSGQFTKCSMQPDQGNFFRDSPDYGAADFSDSEFYGGGIGSFEPPMYFTNCLFFRVNTAFWDTHNTASFTFQNCTFYNGCLVMARTGGTPYWMIENTTFDGTAIYTQYNTDGTNYLLFNYNAYDTGNTNWNVQNFGFTATNTLTVVGTNDLFVTNGSDGYDWESSWFGNFYLPTNSPLLNKGSTNANLLGLYHFTITTNQVIEGTNIVSIGYHYVATTGTNGLPLDSNGDGVPDYIEDANGNGLVDSGEINWTNPGDLGLNVIITQPRNGSILP